jgi:hypothetical protein
VSALRFCLVAMSMPRAYRRLLRRSYGVEHGAEILSLMPGLALSVGSDPAFADRFGGLPTLLLGRRRRALLLYLGFSSWRRCS